MGDKLHSVVCYELLGRIARGGMAEVYLCRAQGAGGYEKLLVIKKIRADFADSKDFVEMFMDEAAISAQLQHRGIGQVFDFGRVNDTYIIAMEYIHGISLRDLLRYFGGQDEPAPAAMVAYIMAEVCAALEHAHTKSSWSGAPLGIIHRDVNPRNVMISVEGEVKLIDFGIAKAAQRNYMTLGGIKGKVSYMSPEQAAGDEVDHRSDIFSAGIVLFELLTGQKLFDGENDINVLKRVERAEVPDPSSLNSGVDPRLETVCLRALSFHRSARYASALHMQQDLEAVRFAEGFGGWELGELVRTRFAPRLEKVRALVTGERKAGITGEVLSPPPEPDYLFQADGARGAGHADDGPTHLFMAPELVPGESMAELPTMVRLDPGGEDTVVENSGVSFTERTPRTQTLHPALLVVLVVLAAVVASGVTFWLASGRQIFSSAPAPPAAPAPVEVTAPAAPAPVPPDAGPLDLPRPDAVPVQDQAVVQSPDVGHKARRTRRRPRPIKPKPKPKPEPLPY